MKALAILMISATCLLAGCACDCDEKLGNTGTGTETVGGTPGTLGNDANSTANGGMGTRTGTNDGTTNTGSGANQGNTGGTATGTNGNTGSGTGTTTTGGTTKAQDPRTYNQSGGGMSYRTDTIDEYTGKDGSASDKGGINNTKAPK